MQGSFEIHNYHLQVAGRLSLKKLHIEFTKIYDLQIETVLQSLL